MEREAYDELYQLEAGHWWYRGMRQITRRVLKSSLSTVHDLRILDAGCGVGGNLTALSEFGKPFGFDYSQQALTYANESQAGVLAQATVEALPYPDASFDLVTSFDVICCREVTDDTRALREFARVLRPGGHVFVRVPALARLRGPHDVVVHGVRRYTTQELRQKIAQVGLIPIRVTYLNSLLMPLIFLIRQTQNLGGRLGVKPRSDVKATFQPINELLCQVMRLEAAWIGSGRNFPGGVSVFCLAKKEKLKCCQGAPVTGQGRIVACLCGEESSFIHEH